MAEEEQEEEQAEGSADEPKKRGMKLFLIIGGVVLLLIAIGVPVLWFLLKGNADDQELLGPNAAQEESLIPEGYDEEEEYDENEEPLGAIYPLETFIVNLSGGKYVRAQVQLEFNTRDVPRRFLSRVVPVRDAIITLLTARTEKDIVSATGREQLKEDLKDLINELLKREEVKEVYFSQFVVQ